MKALSESEGRRFTYFRTSGANATKSVGDERRELQKGPTQDECSNGEVNDEAGHIHEGGYEGC